VVVGGFITLKDGRSFAPKNWTADRVFRAIAAELPEGELRDWVFRQQSEFTYGGGSIDVRELAPATAEALIAAIRRVAARLGREPNAYDLPYDPTRPDSDWPTMFDLLVDMIDAAERGDPPMDLNPLMHELIPPTGRRSGPGWDHQS
jgi:hypothetical protein